ncbi:transposase [Methylosinus sp. LW4]|uniref:transposase n=1 Tax=Methylosinus sp. LW4 TaxID=136993 RepID=UPI000A01A996
MFLYVGAYWILWCLGMEPPERSALQTAHFDTLRLRPVKIAARVAEMTTDIKIHLPTNCPDRNSSASRLLPFYALRHEARGELLRNLNPFPSTREPSPSKLQPAAGTAGRCARYISAPEKRAGFSLEAVNRCIIAAWIAGRVFRELPRLTLSKQICAITTEVNMPWLVRSLPRRDSSNVRET